MVAGDEVAGTNPRDGGALVVRRGERVEGLRSQYRVRETMFALELADRVVARELGKVKLAARKHATDGHGCGLQS